MSEDDNMSERMIYPGTRQVIYKGIEKVPVRVGSILADIFHYHVLETEPGPFTPADRARIYAGTKRIVSRNGPVLPPDEYMIIRETVIEPAEITPQEVFDSEDDFNFITDETFYNPQYGDTDHLRATIERYSLFARFSDPVVVVRTYAGPGGNGRDYRVGDAKREGLLCLDSEIRSTIVEPPMMIDDNGPSSKVIQLYPETPHS